MKKPMLIFVGHKRRSGKDTFVDMVEESLLEKGYSVDTLAFADVLKMFISDFTGLTIEEIDFYKNDKSKKREFKEKIIDFISNILGIKRIRVDRKLIIDISKGLVDNFDTNLILDVNKKIYEKSTADFFIVRDFRLKKEYFGNPLTVKIIKPNKNNHEVDAGKLENDLNDFYFDITIINNKTLKELKEQSLSFVSKIIEMRNKN